MKATVVADANGRTLWAGNVRPGRTHDTTAIRGEGIDQVFRQYPEVHVLLDDGYLGLRRDRPGKAQTPPRKPNKLAAPEVHHSPAAQLAHDGIARGWLFLTGDAKDEQSGRIDTHGGSVTSTPSSDASA